MRRIVVICAVIWLQRMQFQPENAVRVLELEDATEDIDELVSSIKGVTSDTNVGEVQPGGRVIWNSPLATKPTVGGVTRFGCN